MKKGGGTKGGYEEGAFLSPSSIQILRRSPQPTSLCLRDDVGVRGVFEKEGQRVAPESYVEVLRRGEKGEEEDQGRGMGRGSRAVCPPKTPLTGASEFSLSHSLV